jgi:fatty acid desaturase
MPLPVSALPLLIFCFSLTFVAPLAAYYVALHHFNRRDVDQQEDQPDQFIWESRLIAFSVMVGLWFVMFLPIVVWKYMVSLDSFCYSERIEANTGKGTCENE